MKNDGKYLEEAIEEELAKLEDRRYKWRRLPDARAARGRIPRQPADYFLAGPGMGGAVHLECKTLKGKTRRLPMFTQWTDMRSWDEAGVTGVVLAHFYNLEELFLVPVSELNSAKSWVLQPKFLVPNEDLVEALKKLGWGE